MKDLILKISEKTKKRPSIQGFSDWKDICREIMKTDVTLGVDWLIELSKELEKTIPEVIDNSQEKAISLAAREVADGKIVGNTEDK